MRRFFSILTLIAICITTMAQQKLTPQAQLSIQRKKARIARQVMSNKNQAPEKQDSPQSVTLVVKVAKKGAAETYSKMKAAGATVCSKLGQQAVITLPIDSVEALERIDGVLRIDKGHKGKLKTDVTRNRTGVNLLNGPGLPETAVPYSGKGVSVCVVDVGIDFQHPAFKDAEGRSRIKCVYKMTDNGGHKFTVNDPEAGEFTFPGSVYDTPELIATLTTDATYEYHGTHTSSIAAGSISPQGFGGMAPEADLVLIPITDEEVVEGYEDSTEEILELALSFAAAYAEKSGQPMVLNASLNSHSGPHDGTSTMTEAIETVSESLIPVFSVGNEGGYPVHLYHHFSASTPSISTILISMLEDETGEYLYSVVPSVYGYTRTGDKVSVQLALKAINMFTGRLTTLWTSPKCTATPGCEADIQMLSSDDDATLRKYFEGDVAVAAFDNGDGKLGIEAMVNGGLNKLYLFELVVEGSEGTEIDLWDEMAGFGGEEYIGLPGYLDGDSDMSAGDWTSTEKVISVGAYCANTQYRSYDGNVEDTSGNDEESDVLDAIAWFSSYGTSFNNVSQPTVCAPGVNIVSAWNNYCIDEDETVDESMQWQGHAYGAESGTSMACPVVAGVVALWLQANPTLTVEGIKDVMAHSCVNGEMTSDDPIRWGYGTIDAARGIAYITGGEGIRSIPSTSSSHDGVLYDLQGRRVGNNPARGIYIYQGRKIVIK